MALYCGSCGKQMPDDARFCSACGQSVGVSGPSSGASRSMFPGLVRPRAGRKIAGVCQGIANHTGWDVTALRVITVVLGVCLFPLPILAYLIFWLVLPEEPQALPIVPMTPVS